MTVSSTYRVWGWGTRDEAEPTPGELSALAPAAARLLGFGVGPPERPAPLGPLPAPRIAAPTTLAALASTVPLDRAAHALGRSYRDLVRGVRGELAHLPDVVLRPRTEDDVVACVDWCRDGNIAVVPYGGGTSVVGGVEPDVGDGWAGVVSLDLERLDKVLAVDEVSRAARVQGGVRGPALEDQLRAHGLTLRFYPQSFERSSVGGWLATRAAGHFATGPTHIDDLVEAIRAVTPSGISQSRRVPASGAGPSPDRLLLGSEGTLGVITEAWLRVQPRPEHRADAAVAFPTLAAGAAAVRAVVHAGHRPAALRVVDAAESALTGTLASGEAVAIVGVESAVGP
ncbi:MAG: FAD-binding oxidoreductase, partial [Frankia sp.]|nr:FAD-binding oxidoreductase [Frankia sp.]